MTDQPRTVLDALVRSLERARAYKKDAETPPIAVIWPDRARQWERAIPLIRQRGEIVLTLGDYDAATQTGPAIWIRAVLATTDHDAIPIVYLPGVAKEALRAVGQAAEAIQPLLYLQYRGTLFMQPNGKDWTIGAYLQNGQQGLGIAVDSSEATRAALGLALPRLLGRPIEELRRHPGGIDAHFLNQIILPDLPRQILEWISDPDASRASLDEAGWAAFCQELRDVYKLDPERDGPSEAARLLGSAEPGSRWQSVWDRFTEAPANYPGVPDRLRGAKPAGSGQRALFEAPLVDLRWPQDNEEQERSLADSLLHLEGIGDTDEARSRVLTLETVHGPRRESVWARLDGTPLAHILAPLATIARLTEKPCPPGDLAAIQSYYTETGWQIDAAALDAQRMAATEPQRTAVTAALEAIYTPWLRDAATRFQEAMRDRPATSAPAPLSVPPGTCVLFADGLRYDLAVRLAARFDQQGHQHQLAATIGPLPGVTTSAKPAQSPVADLLTAGRELTVRVASSDGPMGQPALRRLLTERSWLVLGPGELGMPDGQARAWTELGQIDSYGHTHTTDLPRQVGRELDLLFGRIVDLLGAGWTRVMIVTDHGWVLTPRPMVKFDLPQHLTEQRKGRCARLTSGAQVDVQSVPWCWDPMVRIAVAPGITCFEEGKRYEHGGLSPQECIIPTIVVESGTIAPRPTTIQAVTWRRLRCDVTVEGGADLSLDIRTRAADPATSIVKEMAVLGVDGIGTALVSDDEYENNDAIVVILDESGHVLAQQSTIVGGE